MGPESKLGSKSIYCPWHIICSPAIMILFLFQSHTALSYCFFLTLLSSGWELGLGFPLWDASLLQVPLQIFYSFIFRNLESERIWGRAECYFANTLEGMSNLALSYVFPAGRRAESRFLSQRWNLNACQLPVITSPKECLLWCNQRSMGFGNSCIHYHLVLHRQAKMGISFVGRPLLLIK